MPLTQPQTAFPLWDGHESVADYAKRTNLPPTKTLDLGGGVTLELVLIPAGKFVMGTPEPESPWIGGTIFGIAALVTLILLARLLWRAFRQHRRPQFSLRWLIVVVLILGVAEYGGFRCWRVAQARRDFNWGESPGHQVTLTRLFYMARFLTTQEQYQQVMGTNPSGFKGASLPIDTMSRDDVQEFCKKVSEKTGQAVRLPTEAEWEFACRAGTTTAYYSGDTEADLGRAAWYYANSGGKAHPVGQKEPNAFGLYDMHGNVWEWCADWYGYYEAAAAVNPQGAPHGQYRVLRGGAWYFGPGDCRSASRADDAASYQYFGVGFGFRLVLAGTP
ncbi:MAG: formylglycine-generating enzyme family protein [Planctomycetota bacterium]|nr:formylglycine-generating enzyme family protein [Planctomycetota bacterium]